MITIELPFPDRVLSPNSRKHWTVKAKATKAAREWAHWMIRDTWTFGFDGFRFKDLRCTFVYHQPKDKRRRWDLKNLDAAMKGAIDGVCDALGIDDSQIKETVSRFGEVDRPNGRVVMTLEAM